MRLLHRLLGHPNYWMWWFDQHVFRHHLRWFCKLEVWFCAGYSWKDASSLVEED